MALNPQIWGPKFWFFFHTIAFTYPNYPNAVTKKKYYDFVQNIPMFLPIDEIATSFSKLLNDFPIQPYLDNKESFIKWFWFIHNKINEKLEKPKITLNEFYLKYHDEYKSDKIKHLEYYKWREKLVYFLIIFLLCAFIFYFYNQNM
jgi:hypothetical protein